MGEVHLGDSIGAMICAACVGQGFELAHHDVVVVAQKIVSKAEGRMMSLDDVTPAERAKEIGRELNKEAALVEVILGESRRVVRIGGRALI
ncbi:MAG: coenzyme F420-0:L-glutamate ligase, partial [Candidatus Binatia bacterium]